MRKQNKNKKQFTLIELIIVIVIIGILAAMALPKFTGVIRNAHVSAMEQDLEVIEKAVMQYIMSSDDWSYPFTDLNEDKIINKEDSYLKTNSISQTLIDTLLNASGDDCREIYKLDMEKLKPYINNLKYPDTEYLYSPISNTAIDPIGKKDEDFNIHHILGGGIVEDFSFADVVSPIPQELYLKEIHTSECVSIALGSDGNLYGCGLNYSGQLATGDYDNKLFFTKMNIPEGEEVKQVVCGQKQTLLLTKSGNLYGTGSNYYGQLGLGEEAYNNMERTNVFQKITLPDGAKPASLMDSQNFDMFVISTDGDLYVAGENYYYELGTGETWYQPHIPTKVEFPKGVKVISGVSSSEHTLVYCSDGNIYGFGDNWYGELGTGDEEDRHTPAKMVFPNGVKPTQKMFISNDFSGVICNDGNIYICGDYDVVANGSTTYASSPTKITFPNNAKPISIKFGDYYGFAICDDGNFYSWGYNSHGQLGLGHTNTTRTPTKVEFPNGVKPISFQTPQEGSPDAVLAICDDGNLYGWGNNAYYQLGLGLFDNDEGYTSRVLSPTLIPLPDEIKVKSIESINYKTIIKDTNNNIYTTGYSDYGNLGLGLDDGEHVLTFQKVELPK